MKEDNIFIIWGKNQARVNSMAKEFGYKPYYIHTKVKNKKLQLIDYLLKTLKTLKVLITNKPNIVWLQLPPAVMLYPLFLYKKLINRNAIIISDGHNAQFRSPWINFPLAVKLINSLSDIIVVHNEYIKKEVESLRLFEENKIYVLEDKIPDFEINAIEEEPLTVLFPASFNSDEPIHEIFETAKLLSEFNFLITGSLDSNKLARHSLTKEDIPSNVKLTGWLTNEEYEKLFLRSSIILGLTKVENIQLSVAVEGIGYEKAMVLSNTDTLKGMFNPAAIFINNEPESMAEGIKLAYREKKNLESAAKELKSEKQHSWAKKRLILNDLIKKMIERK